MTASIIQADARSLPLADDSVDLIVTSPPYYGLRAYTDGGVQYDGQIGAEPTPRDYLDALIDATRESVRVLRPTGSLWVNLGDKYNGSGGTVGHSGANGTGQRAERHTNTAARAFPAKSLIGLPWRYAIGCVDELGLLLRAEVVWSKPNGLPESVTDRVRRSHETWFHFVLQPDYFADLDQVRERYTGDRALSRRIKHVGGGKHAQDAIWTAAHPSGRIPGSVWDVPTQPLKVPGELGVDHYAAFPIEWPRRLIAAWCPPGGVVLDPFGGTGTTALAADVSGRTGISVDMSADYCRVAAWRTTDPGERARAMQVRKPEPVMAGQPALFPRESR